MTRASFQTGASRKKLIATETAETCTHPSAALDLAAWNEGKLSAQGMRQLASHVVRCRACQVVLAAVVQDVHRRAHRVESTRKLSVRDHASTTSKSEDIRSVVKADK